MGLFRSDRKRGGEDDLAALLARATASPADPLTSVIPDAALGAPLAASFGDAEAIVGLLGGDARYFAVTLDRERYAPGEELGGRIVATEDVRGRAILIGLRHHADSDDYRGSEDVVVQDTGATQMSAGEERRFSLRLPDEMVPPIVTGWGRAYWTFFVQVDRRLRTDRVDQHGLPLHVPVTDPATSRPGDGGPAETERRVRGFDGEVQVDRSRVPLGGTVEVVARLDRPGAGRELQVGLLAEARYAVEDTTHDEDGRHTSRAMRTAELFAEWQPIDGTVDTHRLRFTVPDTAPPSCPGKDFSVSWRIRLTEGKRLRRDPQASASLQVVR